MRFLVFASLLLFAAPAAFAQKDSGKPRARAAASDHPFVGTWDYVVRPDDPVAEGTFTIEQRGDEFAGTFMTDEPRPIDPFEVSADVILFTFKQPGMGDIIIRGILAGDRFEGEAEPEGQDALPFVATRQTATTASE